MDASRWQEAPRTGELARRGGLRGRPTVRALRLATVAARSAVACAALSLALRAAADTVFLEFEDLHGRCGELDVVAGPGSVEVDAVRVLSPHHATWSVGSDASVPAGLGNPFKSDALLLFTHGDGATIVFPAPVARVSFMAGLHSAAPAPPAFELHAHGRALATFTATHRELEVVDVRLSPPVHAVTIRFAGGWSSLLGIDSLGYVNGGSCLADLDGDGAVDGSDLGLLLASWGRAGPGDLDHSGEVDGVDIGLLLGSWTEPGGCDAPELR